MIAEMGGKNSIIVDEDADLDAAVEGVAISAFGYQGQKCSACSRAIVTHPVYERFLGRLAERVKAIRVGDPADPGTEMGPIINERAKKTILAYIETGKQEGRLIAGGKESSRQGHFIEPTIIAGVSPRARIAQEEIFGPVLAVIEAPDFTGALAIANNTEYGSDGRRLHPRSWQARPRGQGVPRGQSLLQPQVYRSDGGRPSVRRLQYVGQ